MTPDTASLAGGVRTCLQEAEETPTDYTQVTGTMTRLQSPAVLLTAVLFTAVLFTAVLCPTGLPLLRLDVLCPAAVLCPALGCPDVLCYLQFEQLVQHLLLHSCSTPA